MLASANNQIGIGTTPKNRTVIRGKCRAHKISIVVTAPDAPTQVL